MSERPKCSVVYKGRPPCQQPAGWGTDHPGFGPCKHHGGNLRGVADAARSSMIAASAMKIVPFGEAAQTDPEQALLDLVSQSAALVRFYGQQVNRLADQAPSDSVAGTFQRLVQRYEEAGGLFGPIVEIDKFGTEHIVGEELRGMVKLWNEERDRLSKFAKLALGAGIERRRVEMAERQGEMLVLIVSRVLVALGMSPETLSQARTMIADEMRQIAAGGES